MGALAEASVPAGKRWIPKGMEVAYTAKATSDITCIAETDPRAVDRPLTPTCPCGSAVSTRTAPSWSRA